LLLTIAALPAALVAGCLLRPADDPAAAAPPTQCELCHYEVELAFQATEHAKAGQACAACHGRSAEHSWSEDGHVAPDRPLKTRLESDPVCASCHKKVEHPAALNLDHKCTRCHKPHPHKDDTPEPPGREGMLDEV
jgi:hypothetical protein